MSPESESRVSESERAAAVITMRLAGLRLTEVKLREHDWAFRFGDNANLSTSYPWRVFVDGRIVHADSDHGQKFGLPAPVDGEEATRRFLGHKVVERVTIRHDSGDLSIVFSGETTLEILNMSSGYEGWNLNAAGLVIIGLGGGGSAMFSDGSKVSKH
jgi:hypothetical protein